MAKHTLKFFWCEHRKMFTVFLAIFQNYAWKGYRHDKQENRDMDCTVKVKFENMLEPLRGFSTEKTFKEKMS